MGRKRLWSPEQYDAWRALRERPEFGAVEQLISIGLDKVDLPELDTLIVSSPRLSPKDPLSRVRRAIRDATKDVGDNRRTEALMALLRATDEARSLPLDSAHRLARVKLGEAAPHSVSLERKLGRPPTSLELADTIPRDNGHFRRAPKVDRKPGEYFVLLRELYRELVPEPRNAAMDDTDVRRGEKRQQSKPRVAKSSSGRAPESTNIEAVRKALKRHFRTELELTPLARVLLTDQEAIENLTMEVWLTDDGDDAFRFHVIREFHARFSEYTVAVVIGDDARASITRCIPELKDVIWLPPETGDLDAVVNEMIGDGLLELRDRRSRTGFKAARFVPLDDGHDFVTRLADDGVTSQALYRLLALQIPGGGRELVHFRSSLHMPLQRARRRCAWFADGPTFIDRISIDLSGLSDAAMSEHANVYFMLPGTRNYSTATELESKRFLRVVREWAVRHHGFLIHW
jgi:hypothetical protein